MALPSPPTEWVEIDDTYGLYWWIEVDWTPLLDGAIFRGEDTVIPAAPGRYVNPRTIDETEYLCPGYLFADRLFDGTEVTGDADVRSNMRANLSFLRGFICSPTDDDPRRALVLHDDNDTDWGADVIIDRHLGLTPVVDDDGQSPYCFKVVFRITVPTGELVAVGS